MGVCMRLYARWLRWHVWLRVCVRVRVWVCVHLHLSVQMDLRVKAHVRLRVEWVWVYCVEVGMWVRLRLPVVARVQAKVGGCGRHRQGRAQVAGKGGELLRRAGGHRERVRHAGLGRQAHQVKREPQARVQSGLGPLQRRWGGGVLRKLLQGGVCRGAGGVHNGGRSHALHLRLAQPGRHSTLLHLFAVKQTTGVAEGPPCVWSTPPFGGVSGTTEVAFGPEFSCQLQTTGPAALPHSLLPPQAVVTVQLTMPPFPPFSFCDMLHSQGI
mmetsp:Transcript_1866/g.4265  ORF Transcript_1866/g.4265 Transcript_1866/m.4265 type:complete len:269 (+) Transcript_1866:471-1277(+)